MSQYSIHMHLILQLKGCVTGNQMLWRYPQQKKPQFFVDYKLPVFTFQALTKPLLGARAFPKITVFFEKSN